MTALTLSLTYEERAALAAKYKIDDPNSLTADDIVSGERRFAERRRDRHVEAQYLSLLGIEPLLGAFRMPAGLALDGSPLANRGEARFCDLVRSLWVWLPHCCPTNR